MSAALWLPVGGLPGDQDTLVPWSMSLQPGKTKLSRTSTNKARTGCITCKKRHIKCDEAKPQCTNCLKNRGHCEGYGADQPKASGPVQVCWDSRQVPLPRLPPQMHPDSLRFPDSTSMLYFQEFVGLVQGPWTTAASNGDLWGVTLPQLARSNDTLRYAAMAIGALSTWHHQSTFKSLRAVTVPALQTAQGDAHYFRAIAYYCHSLKLQSQQASVQDAVFLSVLSLFFETLRGNRKAALDHVNHGLAMLLALLTEGDVANFAPDPKPVLAEVADIFTHLGGQARTVLRGRVGHGPSLPNLAKGLRDNSQTMDTFLVLLSRLPRSTVTIDRIPASLSTLDEFEQYIAATQRRQTAMGPIMVEQLRTTTLPSTPTDDATTNDFYANLLTHPHVRAFCAHTRSIMHALNAASLPLINAVILSSPTAPTPTYLRAIHLRLQFLTSYIFSDPPQFLAVETLQARTPLFREYLSLANVALRTAERAGGGAKRNPAHQLALQCGLARDLMIVAFFCRDPVARDEAVWMLRDYPGQDGLWNTRALYELALRNREVERRNAVEGTEGEQWRRLWRREFVFEDGGERIVFRHMERGEEGGWRLVEEVAEVGGEGEEVRWVRQPLTGSGGPLMADLIVFES